MIIFFIFYHLFSVLVCLAYLRKAVEFVYSDKVATKKKSKDIVILLTIVFICFFGIVIFPVMLGSRLADIRAINNKINLEK